MPLPVLLLLLLGAGRAGAEVQIPLEPHAALRAVPGSRCDHHFGRADISPSGQGALEEWLNAHAGEDRNSDGAVVFCLDPGVDYRPDETDDGLQIDIRRSCAADAPCVLRPDWSRPEHPSRQLLGERVVLPAMRLAGTPEAKLSHWHLQGLTIRPRTHPRRTWMLVSRVDDSVFDLLWIDFAGFEAAGSRGTVDGILFGYDSDRNAVQRSLFTDCPDLGTDVVAVGFVASFEAGQDSEDNLVVDNEMRNCSAVVFEAVAVPLSSPVGPFRASGEDCVDDARAPTRALRSWAVRTRVEHNEGYVTPDAYFDCQDGPGHAPSGGSETECSCKEAPFETKHRPPVGHENQIRRNRSWGSRPGERWHCGGSGSNGAAFASGNACAGSTVYAENLVWDAPAGIATVGDDVVVANNVVIDPVRGYGTAPNGVAVWTGPAASRLGVYRNVLVRPRNSFSQRGSQMDVRCNAVLDPLNEDRTLGPRGADVSTRSNFFYGEGSSSDLTFNLTACSDGADGDGCPEEPGDRIYTRLGDAAMERLCVETRRWTGPEWVCFETAATTWQSPHSGAQPLCDLGAEASIQAARLELALASSAIPSGAPDTCQAEPCGSGALEPNAAPDPTEEDLPDPRALAETVAALPLAPFVSPQRGHRAALARRFRRVGGFLESSRVDEALDELDVLRARVDGCGLRRDGNDWIRDCEIQRSLRGPIDRLVEALGG